MLTVDDKIELRKMLLEERSNLKQYRAIASDCEQQILVGLDRTLLDALKAVQVYCKKCSGAIRGPAWARTGYCRNCTYTLPDRTCGCGNRKLVSHDRCIRCQSTCACGRWKAARSSQCQSCITERARNGQCVICGKAFENDPYNRRKTCSDECKTASLKRSLASAEEAARKVNERRFKIRRQNRRVDELGRAAFVFPCVACGSIRKTKKSVLCKQCKEILQRRSYEKRNLKRRLSIKKKCKLCKCDFTSNDRTHSKLCSELCSREYARQRGDFASRRAARRAREKEAQVESVNVKSVFIRDGWTCVYCGCDVKQYASGGWLAGDEATIDHVKPLAVGGEHSYSNVVTACRSCNVNKKDTYYVE